VTFAPDLVLLQLGMQHILYNTPDAYRAELGRAIQILRDRGSLVAVATPPPVAELGSEISREAGGAWERSREFAQVAREVAANFKCACIDAHAAVLARGPVAASPLYQDRIHFTIQGHWLLSNLYAHALGVPGRVLWDDQALTPIVSPPEGLD
jgi:lysophospholipase L1-like esterase